ncbi:MAG: hypothetical protein JWP81_2502, partial [Ferruginibacter sp.]|nr:hypothetical protein [Ferruginibacter sp.]
YYCWAPIMPGVPIDLQFGSWRPHAFYWNVCDRAHIYDKNLGAVMEGRPRANDLAGRITIINNFHATGLHNFYAKGPDVHDVERYTNLKITPVTFRNVRLVNGVGHEGNVMKVYRPSVQNPQPHEFRRAGAGQVNPLQNDRQIPLTGRAEQKNNIESLPTHNDGGSVFSRGSVGGLGGGGRHR